MAKKCKIILLLLVGYFGFAQNAIIVDTPPTVSNDKNWVSSISYNFLGTTINKGVSFYNFFGKPIQQQSWDVLTNRIWASEIRYDYFNRPAFQSLSAPINNNSTFGYTSNFLQNSAGTNITTSDFDSSATLFNPPTLGTNSGTLGWYYSTNNVLDNYQDITNYPYSRTVYSELNPGTVKAFLGGNKINGNWMQSYSFNMPIEINRNPIDNINQFNGKNIIKTVNRNVDGIETIIYTDTDGNTLGFSRSGNEDDPNRSSKQVYSEILFNGYVDIHIPTGCDYSNGNNVFIDVYKSNNINHNNIKIYNLVTESDEITNITEDSHIHLNAGFYRIQDVNNYYGTVNSNWVPLVGTPVKIEYSVNYYDYSLYEYDLSNNLTKSTQTLKKANGDPLQSTYAHNSLGQLITTSSPDEGTASFKYRNDGQIRFSQNIEQSRLNSFSYTNYDNLGRPVESGVYTGTDIAFFPQTNPVTYYTPAGVDSILDDLDGLPQDGRSEQNFTRYDVPDADLINYLTECSLPTASYKQTFISGNVSYTYTQNPETTKTWYSYDVYGRLSWMIQQIPGLSCLKTIDYTYSDIDGALSMVDYQKYNPSERFIHKYIYNLAGQLTDVTTSIDNISYTQQAHYIYNESGTLKRTELAENLQGIDYIYNLQGQLKAINHPSILPDLDPGHDGTTGSAFAGDVFGMAIDYYNGDYTRTGTPSPVTTSPNGTNQYNGNIKATRWNTQFPSGDNHSAYTYQYNKNNWLTQSTFGSADLTGTITNNPNQDYEVAQLNYDSNGNIQTLSRNGYTDASGTNAMDKLQYRYSSTLPNRLTSVKDEQDNVDSNRYNDIRNQDLTVQTGATNPNDPAVNSLDNYFYNDLGQLTMNLQDKVIYQYNANGLVSKIKTISTDPDEFFTLYKNDYSNFSNDTHGWIKYSTLDPISDNPQPFTLGISDVFNCLDPAIYPSLSVYGDDLSALQINGPIKVKKLFSVTPNTSFKLSFDLLIDNQLVGLSPLANISGTSNTTDDGTGQSSLNGSGPSSNLDVFPPIAVHPQVKVNLKRADGTIIYTQTILTLQTPTYCSNYFANSIDTGIFTTSTTDQFITLELEISNDLLINGTNTAVNFQNKHKIKFQKTYLDNLKLEIATKDKLEFQYNDRGQRTKKTSYQDNGNSTTTYYVRDVTGNVMGVYFGKAGPTVKFGAPSIIENTIFGNSRIGVFKRDRTPYSLYELSDHLGNVRAVIQKTSAGLLAITNKTDYYPFGMPMPNKTTTDGNYRYAFQGQEKDPETGMEAFELRLWDGRLGRWLTVDPMGQYDSPYLGMGNNPISRVDPDGGSDGPPTDYVDEAGNLLLHTNDGSNAVITVCNDKLADFLSSVNSSSWGLDTRAWNFQTKAWLVGTWNQGYENAVNSIDTAWARRKTTDAMRTGSFGDQVGAMFASAISQWTSPSKVLGGAMVLVGGMSGSFRNTAVMATESEINAGKTMARRGYDVVLRDPVNVSGVRTSDLLLDGAIAADVYTPTTTNASRVISAIAKKNSQASQVIVDLSRTNLTPRDFGNAVRRVQNAGATNITSIVFINY